MKSVLLGIALMIVISVVGWTAMGTFRVGADEANVSRNNSVRLE